MQLLRQLVQPRALKFVACLPHWLQKANREMRTGFRMLLSMSWEREMGRREKKVEGVHVDKWNVMAITVNIREDRRELPSITTGAVGAETCLCAPVTGSSTAEVIPLAINNLPVMKLKRRECHDPKPKPDMLIVSDGRRPTGVGRKTYVEDTRKKTLRAGRR